MIVAHVEVANRVFGLDAFGSSQIWPDTCSELNRLLVQDEGDQAPAIADRYESEMDAELPWSIATLKVVKPGVALLPNAVGQSLRPVRQDILGPLITLVGAHGLTEGQTYSLI